MADTKPRDLKLAIPAHLAREIRHLAEVSRRSAPEVAAVVFAEFFAGHTCASIRDAWMAHMAKEFGVKEQPKGGDDA